MEWPERVALIDDYKEIIDSVRELLDDLSWAGDRPNVRWEGPLSAFRTRMRRSLNVLEPVRQLANMDPGYFKNRVEEYPIRTRGEAESALIGLSRNCSLLAYLDGDLTSSSEVSRFLEERYDDLPGRWRWEPPDSCFRGACVFAAAISPRDGSPLRVLVPATVSISSGFRKAAEANRAILSASAWRGETHFKIRTVLAGLNHWVQLSSAG